VRITRARAAILGARVAIMPPSPVVIGLQA